jgi:hypothetical protein
VLLLRLQRAAFFTDIMVPPPRDFLQGLPLKASSVIPFTRQHVMGALSNLDPEVGCERIFAEEWCLLGCYAVWLFRRFGGTYLLHQGDKNR